jgi:hypothetical protein
VIFGGPEDGAWITDDPKLFAETFHPCQIDTREFGWRKWELNRVPVRPIDGVEQATGIAAHPPSLSLQGAEAQWVKWIAVDI